MSLSRNESGRFGALKSDSTRHFFRNACTKSGSLRFSVFRLLTNFVCLYTYEFWLSLCKIARSAVILLLPLFNAICLYRRLWLVTILRKILNLPVANKGFSWKDPLSWLRLKVSGCHYNSIYNNTWTKQVKQLSNSCQTYEMEHI
jgi:hypothetical protein